MTYAEQFRAGFGPVLSDDELRGLAEACERNDPKLTNRGDTTSPTALNPDNRLLPVECCCMGAYVFGVLSGHTTVERVSNLFYLRMGSKNEMTTCARWMAINAWDSMPRAEALSVTAGVCRELLAERAIAATAA